MSGPAASEALLRRHPGGWRHCGNDAPHPPHQMSYDPWRACPGKRESTDEVTR